ncbi:MAG: 4Fe-4S binding protein [Xanthomonadales bacterium]|nr:4Fe-4S binding protein [Xanthomonadales bacterium]
MLALIQKLLRLLLNGFKPLLAGFQPASLNPLRHLGSLTIFFFWIVLVSGIWLLIFFRTSVDGAYESVEYLTHSQWYLGGVMRSLHRYASDAAVITLLLHIVREFAFDHHRDKRWFSWITGIPLLWLVIPLGITGYWLVWDRLAQYVALATAELIDWLPIFTDSMARNFLSDDALSDRFFTLMAFLHLIGLPLFLVLGIWLHVFRINGPKINPPRLLMSGSLLAMLLLSLVFPALSQGKADLETVPQNIGLDWFYLAIYPLVDSWELAWVWALLAGISLLIFIAPWLPPRASRPVARVDLDNCNGCERCVADCPFGALTMMPRSDGKAYEAEAVVDADLCLSCGICVGACPTATPFRRRSELVPGIDLPGQPMAQLRETIIEASQHMQGQRRVLVFSCAWQKQANLGDASDTAVISLTCMAQLPPAFLDFILSRGHADGILLLGCGSDACTYRLGAEWTSLRLHRQRDPHLRQRVDSRRIAMAWEQPWSRYADPRTLLSVFRGSLEVQGASEPQTRPASVYLGGRAIAWGLFAAVVGLLSVWPRYQPIGVNEAMVSLSFSHAGERIQQCRQRSQAELDKLPPNMRKPADCPRERHPVSVVFQVDGEERYREVLSPSGFWNDGESTFYQRFPVMAGSRLLQIEMNDSGSPDEYHVHTQSLNLAPGEHVVVTFDRTQQEFRIQ